MSIPEFSTPVIKEITTVTEIFNTPFLTTTRPPESPASYEIKAKTRKVHGSRTALFLVHGAAEASSATPNPTDNYSQFLDTLADDGLISSYVFNARGVGTGENVSGRKENGSQFTYQEISIQQRVTDTVNALFAMSRELPEAESIVIGGVSMGGHVAIRAIEKLREISEDAQNPDSQEAQAIIKRIKGFVGFGPAAYLSEVESLPAGNPKEDRNNPESRTYKLRHTPSSKLIHSPIFETLDKNPNLPLFIAFGREDSIIPPAVKDAFLSAMYHHDSGDFLKYWSGVNPTALNTLGHGLISNTSAKTSIQEAQQYALSQSTIGFIQRVSK